MTVQTKTAAATHGVHSIGTVKRKKNSVFLELAEAFRPGLAQLEHFSHLIALWWADRCDNPESRSMLQTRPPYAEEHLTGVFACRSEYRPNPIAVTVCKILEVNEERGRIKIADIDALDGSELLDIKPYFPVCDRVQEAEIPGWLFGWPEWMPERGLGLEY